MKFSDIIKEIEKLRERYKYEENKSAMIVKNSIEDGPIIKSEGFEGSEGSDFVAYFKGFNLAKIGVLKELKNIILDIGEQKRDVKMTLFDVMIEIEKLKDEYKYLKNKCEKVIKNAIEKGSITAPDELEFLETYYSFSVAKIQVLNELKNILLDKGAKEIEVTVSNLEGGKDD